MREKLHSLAPDFGTYAKMIMTRASFNKFVLGSSEFGEQYKMILGSNEMKLSTGLVSSSLASEVFTGIGLPRIEIKEESRVLDMENRRLGERGEVKTSEVSGIQEENSVITISRYTLR